MSKKTTEKEKPTKKQKPNIFEVFKDVDFSDFPASQSHIDDINSATEIKKDEVKKEEQEIDNISSKEIKKEIAIVIEKEKEKNIASIKKGRKKKEIFGSSDQNVKIKYDIINSSIEEGDGEFKTKLISLYPDVYESLTNFKVAYYKRTKVLMTMREFANEVLRNVLKSFEKYY